MPTLPQGGVRYFRRFLFDQTTTESDWSLGMVRDVPRNAIPTGGAYQLTDFFVDRAGMVYKRGGTSVLNAVVPGYANVVALAAPEFPGGPRVVAEISDGAATRYLFDVTSGTAGSGINLGNVETYENMSFYVDRLVIKSGEPESGPYIAPLKAYLSSGTLAMDNLGGSPPPAKYSCVHAGRLVLGNSVQYPSRIWFSPDVDIEASWDTANSWIDTGVSITGLASIQGVLLVFSRGRCQRILGDIPPGHVDAAGNPTENMTLEPLGDVGCIDARTICYANNLVYFANEHGVYSTNGAGFESLTQRTDGTGISSLWTSTLAGFSPQLGAVVSAGVYLNQQLLVSVIHNSGAKTQFCCYIPNQAWVQLSASCCAAAYAVSFAPTHELYAASPTSSQVRKLSGMWTPTAANKNDADGTAVTPLWETRMISGAIAMKRYGFAHLTYDMRDAASDNPSLLTQIATGLEADSGYAGVLQSPLSETTRATRKRFRVYKDTQGLHYRFTQQNASSKTELYYLETEIGPYYVADGP